MSEWINAADRLPDCKEIDEKCVICSDGHRVFEEFAHLVSWGLATGEITHWMPLPEPPK